MSEEFVSFCILKNTVQNPVEDHEYLSWVGNVNGVVTDLEMKQSTVFGQGQRPHL